MIRTGLIVTLCLMLSVPLFSIEPENNSFPKRKPKRNQIAQQWNLWPSAFDEMGNRIKQLGRPGTEVMEEMKRLIPDFEQQMRKLDHDYQPGDEKLLQQAGTTMTQSEYPWINKTGHLFLGTYTAFQDLKKKLLRNRKVITGLEEATPPGEMVASWFRHAHLFPYDLERCTPLFTRDYLEQLFGGDVESGPNSMSPVEELYTLFKIYYHNGIKYGWGDRKTFEHVEKLYGRQVTSPGPGIRVISQKTPQGTFKLTWKLEAEGWRMDRVDVIPKHAEEDRQ